VRTVYKRNMVQFVPRCWPLCHRWTRWEQYDWRGVTYGTMLEPTKQPRAISMRRQRRHCEVCGKERDELVRNG